MLGNTLALTINGSAKTLVKINQDGYSSEYLLKESTSEFRARVRHTKTKATASRPSYDRHNFELVETVFATAEVAEYERKFYFVIEQKPEDTAIHNADAVCDLAIATADAFLISLMGWES